jgi:hypothetical protein
MERILAAAISSCILITTAFAEEPEKGSFQGNDMAAKHANMPKVTVSSPAETVTDKPVSAEWKAILTSRPAASRDADDRPLPRRPAEVAAVPGL